MWNSGQKSWWKFKEGIRGLATGVCKFMLVLCLRVLSSAHHKNLIQPHCYRNRWVNSLRGNGLIRAWWEKWRDQSRGSVVKQQQSPSSNCQIHTRGTHTHALLKDSFSTQQLILVSNLSGISFLRVCVGVHTCLDGFSQQELLLPVFQRSRIVWT